MSDQSASSGTDPYLYELSDSNQLHNFMELSASDSDDDWGATSPAVTRLATASSPSPEVGSEKYEVKLKEYRLLDDLLKENGTAAIFEEHFLARQASKAAKRGTAQVEAPVASGNRARPDGERQPKPAGRLKHKSQWVRTAPDTGTATARPPKRPCVRDREPGPSASPPSRGNQGHLDRAGDEWRGAQPWSFGAQSPNPGSRRPVPPEHHDPGHSRRSRRGSQSLDNW